MGGWVGAGRGWMRRSGGCAPARGGQARQPEGSVLCLPSSVVATRRTTTTTSMQHPICVLPTMPPDVNTSPTAACLPLRPGPCLPAACYRFVAIWVLYSSVTGYYFWRCSAKKLDKEVPKQVGAWLAGWLVWWACGWVVGWLRGAPCCHHSLLLRASCQCGAARGAPAGACGGGEGGGQAARQAGRGAVNKKTQPELQLVSARSSLPCCYPTSSPSSSSHMSASSCILLHPPASFCSSCCLPRRRSMPGS